MINFITSRILFALYFVSAAVLLNSGTAIALSAGHATCNYCHNLHGGPGNNLLNQPNQSDHVLLVEVVCNNCHDAVDPPIATAPQVVSHNAGARSYGDWRYISCRECHDPHDGQDYDLGGGDSGTNIMMVGFQLDPADLAIGYDTAKIRIIWGDATEPVTNTDHSDPAYLTDVVFADNDGGGGPNPTDFHYHNGSEVGICAICHPNLNKGEHFPGFLTNSPCMNCHPHSTGFIP